jgi:hypothetical protein
VNAGNVLFAQLMEFVPWTSFARIVHCCSGNAVVRALFCVEQFRATALAQLTWRETLRDIEASQSANATKLCANDPLSVELDSTVRALHQAGAFFVTRAKTPRSTRRVRSADADRDTGVIFDQQVMLNGYYSARKHPDHLRIKHFPGTSENAVKTQVWCAVATSVLIAIVKKELQLETALYTCLQIV